MKLAVVVERLSFFKHYGPLLDEALRRGWDVHCWHDYGQPREGPKRHLFPSIEQAPRLAGGRVGFRSFGSRAELSALCSSDAVDAVLSFGPLPGRDAAADTGSTLRVGLQDLIDSIYRSGASGLASFDLFTMHTVWWRDWMRRYLDARVENGEDSTAVLPPVRVTGFPEMDQRASMDPEALRLALGMPPGRPVVLFLPFPGSAHPGAFWPNRIFLETSTPRKLFQIARRRRWRFLKDAIRGYDDRHLVAALRAFCDRSGALLVVKSRLKTPVPEYLATAADLAYYDDSYYPASILQLLSVANLCVSFASAAVLEAAALSVPHLCLEYSLDDYAPGAGIDDQLTLNRLFYDMSEGGLFNFPGVSRVMAIPEAIEALPGARLSDFALDVRARGAYVDRFVGPDDCASAGRLLDAVAAARASR